MTVRTFLDLSTVHLSPAALAWLSESANLNHAATYTGCGNGAPIGTLGATLHGYFMHAPEPSDEPGIYGDVPADLKPVILFAHSLGCHYILFDADADQCDHLPVYDDGELVAKDCRYERAAIAAGWEHGGDGDGFWFNSYIFESWKAAASADDGTIYGSAREICEIEGLLVEGESDEV